MSEEGWVGAAEPVKPISCSLGLVAHPLELATGPPDDIGIDPFQGRTQLRLVEVTIVVDPAADARVVHLRQLSQGFVAAVMQRPAANIAPDALQCCRAYGGSETVREDAPVRLHPHDLPGSKLEAKKVKVHGRCDLPLQERRGGAGTLVCDCGPPCGLQAGATSAEDEDHLLQRCEPARRLPRHPL